MQGRPPQHELIDFLLGVLQQIKAGQCTLEAANRELRNVFLRQNSETPDNLECIENLALASVLDVGGSPTIGLTVRGTQHLLSSIVWKAIEEAGVDLILKKFPDLTTEQANAVLRMCVVTLTNLESSPAP